jgi:hypothetical protein
MSAKLRSDDRAAVDLLLDRIPEAPDKGDGGALYAAASLSIRVRADRLRKVLHLLDLHEAIEPRSDLVARTMERIDSTAHPHPGVMHLGDPQAPSRESSILNRSTV